MKDKLRYLAFLLFGTVSIILGLEGVGRAIIHFNYGQSGKTYGLWKYDKVLGADHRKNAYNTHTSTNDWGFRNQDDVIAPKPSNGLRIIAFGGSTTFGYNLKDEEAFTYHLQQKLKKVSGLEEIQVLNAGRICFSLGHNFILMKRLGPLLKPDYVLIYEGVNEIMNAASLERDGFSLDKLKEESNFGLLGKSFDQNRWLKRNSVIVRFIDYIVKKNLFYSDDTEPEIHPWTIENYEYLLEKAFTFLREQEAVPIVIRYASVNSHNQNIFSDLSGKVATKNNVLVYDMKNHFKNTGIDPSELFIHTGVHVTPRGAGLIAEGIFELILSNVNNRFNNP